MTSMEIENVFKLIKKAQKCILGVPDGAAKNPKAKLAESFELCCGAFFQIVEFDVFYSFDNDPPPIHKRNTWSFLQNISTLDYLYEKIKNHDDELKKVSRAMSIANAAFRISAAAFIVCQIVKENEKGIKVEWPYLNLCGQNDWKRREKLEPYLKDFGENRHFSEEHYLSLIVALRDEYGHCEFGGNPKNNDYLKNRASCLEKGYPDHMKKAIIEILKITLERINKLYPQL